MTSSVFQGAHYDRDSTIIMFEETIFVGGALFNRYFWRRHRHAVIVDIRTQTFIILFTDGRFRVYDYTTILRGARGILL